MRPAVINTTKIGSDLHSVLDDPSFNDLLGESAKKPLTGGDQSFDQHPPEQTMMATDQRRAMPFTQ